MTSQALRLDPMMVTSLVLASLLGLGCHSERALPFDDLVLVTLDTLRADHLEIYGYPAPTSPFLSRLAREGVVFEYAMASSSHTGPSHASILTSRYPPEHGIAFNGQRLSQGIPTLAASLAAADFDTGAFLSVRFLRGLGSGFHIVDANAPAWNVSRPADGTVSAAIEWLRQRDPTRRMFLWVHLYDAHETRDDSSRSSRHVGLITKWREAEGENFHSFVERARGLDLRARPDLEQLFALYDAQIAFIDSQLEHLYEELARDSGSRRRLWVVTSDHGEGLGNHDYCCHDGHLFEEQLRVPLLIHGAGPWRAGTRVDTLARHVDVAPTVLDLLNVERFADSASEGHSLVRLLGGRRRQWPMRPAYAVRRPAAPHLVPIPAGHLVAGRDERYKILLKDGRSFQAFDILADPLETTPLAPLPREARELLRWLLAKDRSLGGSEEDLSIEEVEPDIAEELRALGYLR